MTEVTGLDTFVQLQQAVQADLNIGDESSFVTLDNVKLAVNRAYRKAGALFPWPELQDAKKTTTQVDQDYYDYPSNWRSNSIWKLRVNLVNYGLDPDGSPMSFDDYLIWKEENPNSTEKRWANQWRRYFITPTPTVAGLAICIWGYMVTTWLTADDDVTIFSYSNPEGNEAVILEAVAILKSKGEEEKSGEFRSTEAKQLLAVSWGKIRKEQAKYEKEQPFFDVPDFFGPGNANTTIGDFE